MLRIATCWRLLAMVVAWTLPWSVFAACGTIPSATYPIYGATSFAIGNSGTITSGGVTSSINAGGSYSGTLDAVNSSSGAIVAASLTLPTFEPSTFPTYSGVAPPASPIPAGVYTTINVTGTTVFSGGTYYIDTLNINNNRTAQLAPGDYYIKTLNFGSGSALAVSPAGVVRIYIRDQLANGPGGAQFNVGGVAANTQIFMYSGAQFTLGSNVNFVGMVYAPNAASTVTIGSNVNFTGALMTDGPLSLGNGFNLTVDSSLSTVSTCYASQVASYHMDEAGWTGAASEVLDSSGNGRNGQAVNAATTAGASPAIAGSPGTCRYGVFDGTNDYVALPGFPNLTTNFTVTGWIRTTDRTKAGQRILIDDENNTGGWGFSLADGGTGQVRFFNRNAPIGRPTYILDTPNVITNNTWYFVSAVADITNKTKRIYVYNTAGTQVANVSQSFGYWSTDNGMASIGGETNASAETGSAFHFSGNLDEVNVFNGALNAAQIQAVMATTRICIGSATPGRFNAYETTTAAGAISGVIKTKVAGQAFNLDLIAINTAGTGIETAFVGDVKVELLDASDNTGAIDANGCRGTWTTIQTLPSNPGFASGDSGRKTVSFQENNAWKDVRVRVTYPATGSATAIGCSNDNFAIRPASFASVAVSDTDWATAGTARNLNNTSASGGVVHKAGQPLRVSATAVNALGNTTSNYVDRPAATPVACLLPTGCSNANLGTFTLATNAVAGVLADNTATYSEVGSFTMQLTDANFAAVDAGDGSTATERTIVSTVIDAGRFVPDHFDLAANNTPQLKTFNDATCATRSFTYIGQPFGYVTAPQAAVVAKNAAGATTVNYANDLWKLTTSSVTQTYSSVPASPALTSSIGVPTVTSNNNGTGFITANGSDTLTYTRGTTPVAPFNANISLAMSAQDTAENAASQGIIGTTTAATFNGGGTGIAFDAGNEFRYGRLQLSNAHGSERLALNVPVRGQYFNGSVFVTNASDSCTAFSLATALALGNYQRNLNPGETTPSPATVTLAAGVSAITLSAPGVGNSGSVDLTLTVPSWLQFNWTGALGNPKARATFGVYRNANEFIYMRESY